MPEFVPGLHLSKLFYQEAVKLFLDADFPGLQYSAALIGSGSEVLGFDTEMSSDHHWGPRVMIFLSQSDCEQFSEAIDAGLRRNLPTTFRGYSTNFTLPNPDDNNTQLPEYIETGPVNHRVEILTAHSFILDYLNFDIEREIEPADWLTFPEQKLRTITAGAVFHDSVGLQALRDRFDWYPFDVWLYLLAAGWARIGQEEHLMGRAGLVGDELGSSIIGSRLVRDIMRLCFLMEKQYAPYAKWFGTAFKRLPCAKELWPILSSAQWADTWQEREEHLSSAYEYLSAMHNALKITEPLSTKPGKFFGRPFQVIAVNGFADAIIDKIMDSQVKHIAGQPLIGSVDQFSDSTDILSEPGWRMKLRRLYE